MSDTQRCARCKKTPDATTFTSTTSAWCESCWSWQTDNGRKFADWCGHAIDTARGIPRGPFTA